MQTTWNPPSTAVVGEEIDLGVELCSPEGRESEHDITFEGTPVITEQIGDVQICLEYDVGLFHTTNDADAFESDPLVKESNGNLIVTEPGTYTLNIDDYYLNESHTITIEPGSGAGLSLSLKSGIANSFCGGETAEAVFEATSGEEYANGSATVVSNNLITGDSSSQEIAVAYDEVKEVTASIDIPEDVVVNNQNIISVEVK